VLRRTEDHGIERLFHIKDVIDVGFRDQQGVARVTGSPGEEREHILGLPDSMRRLYAFDDLTEDASLHEQSSLQKKRYRLGRSSSLTDNGHLPLNADLSEIDVPCFAVVQFVSLLGHASRRS